MQIERLTNNTENIDTIIDNYTKTLLSTYLSNKILNDPKILARVRKVVEEELKKIIKVEVL